MATGYQTGQVPAATANAEGILNFTGEVQDVIGKEKSSQANAQSVAQLSTGGIYRNELGGNKFFNAAATAFNYLLGTASAAESEISGATSGGLSQAERIGIDALERAANEGVLNGDTDERAVGVFNDKNGLSTRDKILHDNSPGHVNVNPLITDPSIVIVGHTHTYPGDEEFSVHDRTILRSRPDNPYRAQFLLRTESGAIRSMKIGPNGATVRETLQGEPIDYYPNR